MIGSLLSRHIVPRLANPNKPVPILTKYFVNRQHQQEQFWQNNRRQVLDLYRFLLKKVSKFYPRRLQGAARVQEIRMFFRETSTIINRLEIQNMWKTGRTIRHNLETGKWTAMPQYVPNFGMASIAPDIWRE